MGDQEFDKTMRRVMDFAEAQDFLAQRKANTESERARADIHRQLAEDILNVIARVIENETWNGIDSLPDNDIQILAKTDDGRVMIWSTRMLRFSMRTTAPNHLQFPATRWRHIPKDRGSL